MSVLSIIVPVYNEQDTIEIFYKKVKEVQKLKINDVIVEFWFIDDGSNDDSVQKIKNLRKLDKNIHFISFSRNFGKEAALYAGLKNANGEFVAVMDVDLQDPPELLPKMLEGVRNGKWDVVGTKRINRVGRLKIRRWFSILFYKFINKISDTKIVEGARDYRVMSRQVVTSILDLGEYNRFSKGIFSWVGFRQTYIEFDDVERVAGKTSWSFWELVRYSIEGIVSFSQTPLVMVSLIGIVTFILAVLSAIFVIVRALLVPGASAFGWSSMVVIILAVSGIQLFSLGIVGRYISSVYLEVKKRPLYIEREKK
jgi:glycosyltransferase involved in cell wall biosynthesis